MVAQRRRRLASVDRADLRRPAGCRGCCPIRPQTRQLSVFSGYWAAHPAGLGRRYGSNRRCRWGWGGGYALIPPEDSVFVARSRRGIPRSVSRRAPALAATWGHLQAGRRFGRRRSARSGSPLAGWRQEGSLRPRRKDPLGTAQGSVSLGFFGRACRRRNGSGRNAFPIHRPRTRRPRRRRDHRPYSLPLRNWGVGTIEIGARVDFRANRTPALVGGHPSPQPRRRAAGRHTRPRWRRRPGSDLRRRHGLGLSQALRY